MGIFGRVSAAEHEKVKRERDAALERAALEERTGAQTAFDLAEANKTVSALTDKNVELVSQLQTARGDADALRPDAEAWRDRKTKAADYEQNRRVRPVKTPDNAPDLPLPTKKTGARK